jgi:hypothetical protein
MCVSIFEVGNAQFFDFLISIENQIALSYERTKYVSPSNLGQTCS